MSRRSVRREAFPVGCERRSARLHCVFTGSAPGWDREACAVLERVLGAAGNEVHLNDLVREFGPEVEAVVKRLLVYPPADATLVWRRGGRLVYAGQRPQAPVLPVGQSVLLPGFDVNDWLHNARPERAVAA